MGHLRNQYPPDTAKWRPVVAALVEQESISVVAEATMEAAVKGLEAAKGDKGLSHAVWLLAKIADAARSENFNQELVSRGLDSAATTSSLELVASFSDAMDNHLLRKRARTDIGEMAQCAAAETLSQILSNRASGLWGDQTRSVQDVLREHSTTAGFSELAHKFFARFTERYLGYHLSRELSQHVGPNQRFSNPQEHSEFLERIGSHSRQVAEIVKEFAGGWYSKSRFETGLSEQSASGFASYCLTKIRAEIKRRSLNDAR